MSKRVANLGYDKLLVPIPVFIGDTLRASTDVSRSVSATLRSALKLNGEVASIGAGPVCLGDLRP